MLLMFNPIPVQLFLSNIWGDRGAPSPALKVELKSDMFSFITCFKLKSS